MNRPPSQRHVTLVAGPPCGGKSTWVQQHQQPGDIVIDFDVIAQALGSTDSHDHTRAHVAAAKAARNAVLRATQKGELPASRVWIVSANPKAEALFPHHELVMCDPGKQIALQRAAQRPALWVRLIEDWYRIRSSGPGRRNRPASRRW